MDARIIESGMDYEAKVQGSVTPLFDGCWYTMPAVSQWVREVHNLITTTIDNSDDEDSPWGWWQGHGIVCRKCKSSGAIPNKEAECRLCFIDWPHEECLLLRCFFCGVAINDGEIKEKLQVGDVAWRVYWNVSRNTGDVYLLTHEVIITEVSEEPDMVGRPARRVRWTPKNGSPGKEDYGSSYYATKEDAERYIRDMEWYDGCHSDKYDRHTSMCKCL